MDAGDVAANRSHRPRQAGAKYDKKKRKEQKKLGRLDTKNRKNNKARTRLNYIIQHFP